MKRYTIAKKNIKKEYTPIEDIRALNPRRAAFKFRDNTSPKPGVYHVLKAGLHQARFKIETNKTRTLKF